MVVKSIRWKLCGSAFARCTSYRCHHDQDAGYAAQRIGSQRFHCGWECGGAKEPVSFRTYSPRCAANPPRTTGHHASKQEYLPQTAFPFNPSACSSVYPAKRLRGSLPRVLQSARLYSMFAKHLSFSAADAMSLQHRRKHWYLQLVFGCQMQSYFRSFLAPAYDTGICSVQEFAQQAKQIGAFSFIYIYTIICIFQCRSAQSAGILERCYSQVRGKYRCFARNSESKLSTLAKNRHVRLRQVRLKFSATCPDSRYQSRQHALACTTHILHHGYHCKIPRQEKTSFQPTMHFNHFIWKKGTPLSELEPAAASADQIRLYVASRAGGFSRHT